MNVLYVTHYSAMFGANRALCEMALNCRKNGVNPSVVTLLDGDIGQVLKRNNIPCHIVGGFPWTTKNNTKAIIRYIKSVRNVVVNWFAAIKIVRICKDEQIDIIHTNSSVVNVGAMAARLSGIPHIWHVREFGDQDYHLQFYFGRQKAIRYMEKHSDEIVTISNVLQQYYKPYIGDPIKWRTIYDGVEYRNYITETKKVDKKLSILFMGVLQDTKNQMELLEALDILINREQCEDVEVFFCGGNQGVYADKMKKYAEEHGLGKYVQFAGNVNDVRPFLEKCNVGITASKMEAFGRVTIEYMYAKLCVVASDSGANVEILNDEVALKYELGHAEDLANCLKRLYFDNNLVEKLAENGYKYAMAHFTAERNANDILSEYKRIISERNKR